MTGPDDLARRVAIRAKAEDAHLPAPVSDPDVALAEEQLGFCLPLLLARLYREVGNGGFGPDYRLLPLIGAGTTAVSSYPIEPARSSDNDDPQWPHGVLPIPDWECGMYAAVDCLSPGAPVLLFEPNGVEDDWSRAWYLDSPSLADWLEAWLNGTGWYEEEIMMADDAPDPQPWPAAKERLTSTPAAEPSTQVTPREGRH